MTHFTSSIYQKTLLRTDQTCQHVDVRPVPVAARFLGNGFEKRSSPYPRVWWVIDFEAEVIEYVT